MNYRLKQELANLRIDIDAHIQALKHQPPSTHELTLVQLLVAQSNVLLALSNLENTK